MAAPADAMYITEDAVITMASNYDLTVVSGTITLGADWRTLPNQNVTVGAGATVIIPEGKTFTILCDVIVEGTITINGSVVLGEADATLTAAEGLTITTTAGDKVWYTEGKYIVHNHTVVTDEAKDATCTETGLTEGKHCSECGEVLVKQEETPIIDHEYENGVCTGCGIQQAIDPTNDGTFVFFIIAMMSVAGLVVLVCKKKIF